ncbi:MAG: flagellar export protein FliJ [Piscirickettsiaceae bacterium]|nr:MAG: flagellar export protein FliJ [Piscirickettsiaceae bacterium]
MKRSKRLEPVRRVAKNKEAAAAQKMGDSVQKKASDDSQLEKLKKYRDDYIAEFKTKGEQGISASRLQEYQTFVQKIDRAIVEQIKTVKSTQQQVEVHKKDFQKMNSRKKVVEKLIDKSVKQEFKNEQRKEQNEADDRPSSGGTREDVLMWRLT